MIRFQTISTSDVQHYQFMENLLIAAFPPEEYRELKELREYTCLLYTSDAADEL